MKTDINKINSRIKRRQVTNLDGIYKKKKGSFWYNAVMSLMVLLCFSLGVLIYGKHDEKGTFLKERFNINIDFTKINKELGKVLSLTIDFNFDGFSLVNKTQKVSASSLYYQLDDNVFYNDKQVIYSFSKGTVSKVSKTELTVKYDNGYKSIYINPMNCKVKTDDRVEKGTIIGEFLGQIEIYFYDANLPLSYVQAISNFA